jgi:hypothetical protein
VSEPKWRFFPPLLAFRLALGAESSHAHRVVKSRTVRNGRRLHFFFLPRLCLTYTEQNRQAGWWWCRIQLQPHTRAHASMRKIKGRVRQARENLAILLIKESLSNSRGYALFAVAVRKLS